MKITELETQDKTEKEKYRMNKKIIWGEDGWP
jgi:hypothetical protein